MSVFTSNKRFFQPGGSTLMKKTRLLCTDNERHPQLLRGKGVITFCDNEIDIYTDNCDCPDGTEP